jgi:hypothetical protein
MKRHNVTIGELVAFSILLACGQITFEPRKSKRPKAIQPRPKQNFKMPPALAEQAVSIERFLTLSKEDWN